MDMIQMIVAALLGVAVGAWGCWYLVKHNLPLAQRLSDQARAFANRIR